MKKLLFSSVVVLFALMTNAQPPAGDAKPGEWYGEKITADGAVDIAGIPAKLEKAETIDTKIKAKIVEVCPNKGCWLKLQVNDSTTAMVKMKDYGFFLPMAAKGKTVVIDGEIKMKTMVFMMPEVMSEPVPALAITAPTMPPISACDELLGMP